MIESRSDLIFFLLGYGLLVIGLWELSKPYLDRLLAKLKAWRATPKATGANNG